MKNSAGCKSRVVCTFAAVPLMVYYLIKWTSPKTTMPLDDQSVVVPGGVLAHLVPFTNGPKLPCLAFAVYFDRNLLIFTENPPVLTVLSKRPPTLYFIKYMETV